MSTGLMTRGLVEEVPDVVSVPELDAAVSISSDLVVGAEVSPELALQVEVD